MNGGDRLFLDANVLFSAAWRQGSGLSAFWHLPGVALLTSGYAAEEAMRNLGSPERVGRLRALLESVVVVVEAPHLELPGCEGLREKDRPIVQAALACGATHLITGDLRDFGPWLGGAIGAMRVERPAVYLSGRLRNES